MSRAPLTYRQRDLEAAMRAAKATGFDVARIEIDKTGKIVIIASRQPDDTAEGGPTEWDEALR